MEVIKRHPDFKKYEIQVEPALQIPEFEIHLDLRKIFQDQRENSLTNKGYDILYF